MKKQIFFSLLFLTQTLLAQQQTGHLTVEKIMSDPKWIGTSPANPYWSSDGKMLLFSWNPDKSMSDSLYFITADDLRPRKASAIQRRDIISYDNLVFNDSRTAYTYSKDGDIYMADAKTHSPKRITHTVEVETNPSFLNNDTRVVYTRNQNLYAWEIATGSTEQITRFEKGDAPKERKENLNDQEQWLRDDQLRNFEVLKFRKQKRDSAEAAAKSQPKQKELKAIYYQDKVLTSVDVSPDGRFITYRLVKPATLPRNTIVPNYVTESGFTQDISGRLKVGAPTSTGEFFIFDRQQDSIIQVKTDQIPGIMDQPDYVKDYPQKDTAKKKSLLRNVSFFGPWWNDKGTRAVVEVRAQDNKDRWLMLLDASTGNLKVLDRQRDEAWVGGPGVFLFMNNIDSWIDDNTFWYQSEASGYSHIYKINVDTGEKTQLTSGAYEVQEAVLSFNKKYFFITTNQVHPGEKQFYRLPVTGGSPERITSMTGANTISISPDEKQIAILYSYSNKPWELYIQQNKSGARAQQVTNKAMSEDFKSYKWREGEMITFTASDGATVYARLYRSANAKPGGPAVIFVHGAGYLQNAHKWWSSYFREYMFNNLLADNGYTVMDIDYRGSAGYGRNWRTGIYRFMGGKDLDDHVDAAKYLTQKLGVDPKRIGLYGGSYGGFITLMAMFTKPDVFAAGAGLRCVTDWAHYNPGYTSNILNEPFTDSIAYKKSSPIYYANGLKGALLMCHGMVDVNVHFQDIVRLSQRLIELHKDNWELAVYPMEDHAFVEPSSWADEYSRIFKLFEKNLKN